LSTRDGCNGGGFEAAQYGAAGGRREGGREGRKAALVEKCRITMMDSSGEYRPLGPMNLLYPLKELDPRKSVSKCNIMI